MNSVKGHIKIYTKEEKRIDGRPVYSEVVLRECIAEVLDLYGNELYTAMSNQLQNTAIFKVRYCKSMDILRTKKKDYKVSYNGIEYSIYQADFAKYSRKFVMLKCNYKS